MVPVRLRGHHFLCIMTYRGFGYTAPFVDNITGIVGQIEAGRPVELCQGADDICDGFTALCGTVCDHDCTLASTIDMDRLAIASVAPWLPELQEGRPLVLTRKDVAALRVAFADGKIRPACSDCLWRDFCTGIADDGFSGTKLFAPG